MPGPAMGVLADLDRCIGCRACQVACKSWNGLEAERTSFFAGPAYQNPRKLSSRTFTLIEFFELPGLGKPVDLRMVKRQCMHCLEPACAAACIVGALRKTDDGPVVYDSDRCMGCRYCMVACPFGVPTYEWERALPLIRKCTFCADRQGAGLAPSCAATCPTGALEYGLRADLLVLARKRMAERPGRYVDHVFGEREVGGTSWLYISPVDFASLGFPADLGGEPAARYASKAMGSVPYVFAGVVVAMGALRWIARRKGETDGGTGPGDPAPGGDQGGGP